MWSPPSSGCKMTIKEPLVPFLSVKCANLFFSFHLKLWTIDKILLLATNRFFLLLLNKKDYKMKNFDSKMHFMQMNCVPRNIKCDLINNCETVSFSSADTISYVDVCMPSVQIMCTSLNIRNCNDHKKIFRANNFFAFFFFY